MKKVLLSLAIMFAVVCYVNAQVNSQTFKFSATVLPYLEVNPSNLSNEVNPVGAWNHTKLNPGNSDDYTLPGWPAWKKEYKDNVYANAPFTVVYTGSSEGASFPILSRKEVNGALIDRLQTLIIIRNEINGEWDNFQPGHESHDMKFISGPDGAASGDFTGQNQTFVNPPHDGEVSATIWMSAALPHAIEFGVDNKNLESADAGLYTCEVVATYAIVPVAQ